jgi:hypothetical protein
MKHHLTAIHICLLLSAGLATATAVAAQPFEYRIPIPGLSATGTPPPSSMAIVQNGATRNWSDGTEAVSCAAYLAGDGTHQYTGATGDGVYSIAPSGSSATNAYCDMTNGGWTLVALATVNVDVSGWYSATGNYNVPSVPSATFGTTWKYADSFLNAIPKHVYKLYSPVGYTGTWYADGRCTYGHQTAALGYCASIYADEGLATLLKTGNGTANGISDANNGYHILTNNQSTYSTYGWCTGNGSSGQGGCGSQGTSSSFSMWVK